MALRWIASLRPWAKRIKSDAMTLWFARRDPETPWYAKAMGAFVVAYALSPIDLIPDFIPVLGYLDDVLLLPVLIWLTLRMLPPPVLERSRARADAWLRSAAQKPRSLAGAFVIVAGWLLAVGAVTIWLLC